MPKEYMRDYRKTVKPRNERDARAEGRKEGVEACVRFLRQFIGDRAFTGHHAARLMEKAVGLPSGDVEGRRRLVQSLGGSDPA